MSPLRLLALSVSSGLAFAGAACASDDAPHAAERPGFAHEHSDLTADPRIQYGELDNGVRYAVMENDDPTGTLSIRLRIAAGSLSEADGDEGLAHYLEHMAFNGSENVPEGEMVKMLERLGLAFGADTNAHVSFDETVYKLNLPNTDDEVVDAAFMLMRETASNLTLAPDSIERERGVIVSEMRSRNTLGFRQQVANMAFFGEGSNLTDRLPIGTIESIEAARSEQFRDFYETHYHPERAFVVVVGDMPADAMVAHIEEAFGDWRIDREPAAIRRFAEPAELRPDATGQFVDPDSMSNVAFAVQRPFQTRPDTTATRLRSTRYAIANRILTQRFIELSQEPGSPLQRGSASRTVLQGAVELGVVNAGGAHEDRFAVLAIVEQEVRRALEHGFSQVELDRVLASERARLERRAEAADSVQTHARFGSMIDAIVSSYDNNRVRQHPVDQLDWFNAQQDTFTLPAIEAAFAELWAGHSDALVFISTNEEIEDLETRVAETLAQSRATPVEAPAADEAQVFAYTDFGAPGEIVEDVVLEDVGVRTVRFANNVRLNIKQTDYSEGQVQVYAQVGDGPLSLPVKDEGLRRLALNLLSRGGLEAHTSLEITDLHAGTGIGTRLFFDRDTDHIMLNGSASADRLEPLLNLLTAYTVAPGVREEAGERYKDRISAWYPTHDSGPIGVISREVPRLIRSGDPRYGFDDLDNFINADHETASRWLVDELTRGAIEIGVVGDIDPDTVITQVARTFGAVEERPLDRGAYPDMTALQFPAGASEPHVFRHSGEANQAVLRVYWPAPDGVDPQTRREMRALRSLLRARMVEEIRERSGAAYSPGAGYFSDAGFPGYGYIFVTLDITPETAPSVLADVEATTAALQAGDFDEDAFQRAMTPLLEDLETSTESNGYWMNVIADAQSAGDGLEAHRTREAGYRSITIGDLRALAAEVFDNEAAVRVLVLPETSAEAGGDDGAEEAR